MKLKKLGYCALIATLMLGLTTGCTEKKEASKTKDKTNVTKKEEKKGNCELTECVNLLEITNTLEEANKIIGFDGEAKGENTNKYYWKFSDTTGIELTVSTSGNGSISATIDKKEIANKKVDFSRYDEIKTALKSGQSLTYDEFVEKVGGVQGTLVGKSSYSNRYTWVNTKGGYLTASFSVKTGKCTIVTGRY